MLFCLFFLFTLDKSFTVEAQCNREKLCSTKFAVCTMDGSKKLDDNEKQAIVKNNANVCKMGKTLTESKMGLFM